MKKASKPRPRKRPEPAKGRLRKPSRPASASSTKALAPPDNRSSLLTLVENSRDAMFVKDLHGRYLIINPAGAALLGRSVERIVGMNDTALFPPETARQIMERDRQIILTGQTETFEEVVTAAGVTRTYLTTKCACRDQDGRIIALLGTARDITESKRAEAVLKETEARFKTVIQATNDVIWEWDLQADLLWWSDNVFERFGYRIEELEPGAAAWINRLHPDEKDRVVSGLDAAIQSKEPFWSDEYRFRRSEGSYAYVYDRAYIHFDERGEAVRMTGAIMDITERKQAQDELQKREEQLWRVLGEREQLARDLHDNIIQKVYGIGLSLEEGTKSLQDNPQAGTETVKRAISNLNGVIRDVRNYISEIDIGTISSTRLRTELADLVRVSAGSLLPRFRLLVDPQSVAQLSEADAKQVLLIAREALSNSLRHSHARSGFVSLRTEENSLRLVIVDDGVGFDSRKDEPLGHGLRNMASRAQQLGGRFEVTSEPGQGTRILVDIPRK